MTTNKMAQAAEAEFEAFYRRTAPKVIHLIYATTGDLTVAQDCTQEAYARAWQRWDDVSRYDEPLAWIRTVARRLAISQWRSRQREQRALIRSFGDLEDPGDPQTASADTVAVRGALASLTPDVREAVCPYYIYDLSLEQIAREVGVPANTIKARLYRGRAALAKQLQTRELAPAA